MAPINANPIKNDAKQPWKSEIRQATEAYIEDYGPPIHPGESITGGYQVIGFQSECPFKAFAMLRMGLRPLQSPGIGFSAKDRGIMLHHALEVCWRQLKSHENLCAMEDADFHHFCEETARSTVDQYLKNQDTSKYSLLWIVEKLRLQKLIENWLTLEKNRPPFVVLEHETKRFIKIGDLTLTIQIDRIDQLNNGNLMIIDYKSGKNAISAWFGERPEQPQLPIYYVYGNPSSQPFSAVAFAQLRADDLKFLGLHDETLASADFFPKGVKAFQSVSDAAPQSWTDLSRYWQNILQQLSNEFCQGNLCKDPMGDRKPCKTCELKAFCRIDSKPSDHYA
jgi:ATP-dependent helicase/nuclease subunit B